MTRVDETPVSSFTSGHFVELPAAVVHVSSSLETRRAANAVNAINAINSSTCYRELPSGPRGLVWSSGALIGCLQPEQTAMGTKKRSRGDLRELEDLVIKHARIEESGWTGLNERTFIAVKPDGVQRRLVGEIVRRFEKKGFKLVGLKLLQASEDVLRDHYWDLRSKPFFSGLITYMSSGPVVAMVWQGLDVVKTARRMLGETNPADSLPGTVRGDYGVEVGRNVIHGSDSVGSAQKEISLWFRHSELQCWEDSSSHWIYN